MRNSSLYLRYFYSRGPTNVKSVHCTVRCLLLETKFHQLVPSSSPFMIQQTVLYTKKTVKKKTLSIAYPANLTAVDKARK